MTMWPQVLVAIFMVAVTVMGFVRHGKVDEKPIDRTKVLWTSLWVCLVLGLGGFWSPR